MNFQYQRICSNLLKDLSQRTNEVIERRFGLKTGQKETLEAIGKSYGITRERVRQIEEEGLSKIRPKLKNCQDVIQHFDNTLKTLGGLKKEEALLYTLGKEKNQNPVFFLLTLADNFKRYPEDDDFYAFWAREKKSVDLAKKVVNLTLNKLEKQKSLLTLEQLFEVQKKSISNISNKKIFQNQIEISKRIEKNPDNQLGLKDWIEINPRGIKDKAYLIFKKENRPLHFTQVANLIESSPYFSQRKAHPATVHNELIKDSRFVLVGRGLYALTEWGYEPGVVKDVILKVLKEAKKPLSKKEILEKVLKQRLVKSNTVLLNLQDRECFVKDSGGRYKINSV